MKFLLRIVAAAAVVLLAGLAVTSSGGYDVSARERHWPVTERLIEWVRNRSIAAHAKDILVPASLDDHDRVVAGMAHYREHCAVCHGGPGTAPDDMAEGMYPAPPDLQKAARRRSPAELFWIIKNGIKMSGMPAWADHGDADLWSIVALVVQLPSLKSDGYAKLAAEAEMIAGGHHHHHPGSESEEMEEDGHHQHHP